VIDDATNASHTLLDEAHLLHAARLALRGHGGAEPNPLVGCIIVDADGNVVGWGYHRRCGEAHAEIAALERAGTRARDATVYVTLEPCNHTGRTGPCVDALIEAGVRRVVVGRRDPSPEAGGGVERLRAAGIAVDVLSIAETAAVSEPFIRRVRLGLPWVTVKWAQTVDGRIATRTGKSQWISGVRSRRMVHRERGRVDAILTGIGTVLADDPMLTARDVRRRRVARRVIVDPRLETPPDARVVTTAREAPTTIFCARAHEAGARAAPLHAAGIEIIAIDSKGDELSMEAILRALVERHESTHVLVEAGPGLIGRIFAAGLANEAWIFIAPLLLADDEAVPAARGRRTDELTDGARLDLLEARTRDADVALHYAVHPQSRAPGTT